MQTLKMRSIVSYDYESGTWNVTDKREGFLGETLYQITRKSDGQVCFWIRRKFLNTPKEAHFAQFRDQ